MQLVTFLMFILSVQSACKSASEESPRSELEARRTPSEAGNCILLCYTDLKGEAQETICKEQVTKAECKSQESVLIKNCSNVRCIDREIKWVKADAKKEDPGVPLGNCVLYAKTSDVVLNEVNGIPEKQCTLKHPNFKDSLKLPGWGELATEWKPSKE